jgi:ketosteroid isomerase-like protein
MKKLFLAAWAISVFWACSTPESKPATSAEPVATKKPPVEYGDTALVELCKKSFTSLVAGDVDGFTANLGDSAIYHFNNFDSLVGKAAITNFWKDRRKNVLDKISFTDDIWLPLKVTEDGTSWVFYWTTVDATYKTGKSMRQRMHFDYHFAKSGQIDVIYHYRDQLVIDKASKK